MALDYSQVNWTKPNNAYYGIDDEGNYYIGQSDQSIDAFSLLPVLYNKQNLDGEYLDILANVILFGYMPADKNIKIPENHSELNVLTRYSRIGDGSMFKDYSYKDLGSILETLYATANTAANSRYFVQSDKMSSTIDGVPAVQLPQNEVISFHDMELTSFDSSLGEDIVVSTDNQLGDILNGTTLSANENVFSILKKIFTKRIVSFTYKAPTVSFSGSSNSSVEYGTTVDVNIGYTYNQNDGPSIDTVTTSGSNSGSFKPLPTATSKSFTYKVSWPEGTLANGGTLKEDSYGCYNGIKGTTYLTNATGKGYAPDSDKHATQDALGNYLSSCAASSASKTVTVSGFYYAFYSIGATEFTDLSSDTIRAMNKIKKGSTYALTCAEGTKAIIFASPTKVTSITQKSAMNAECLGSFTQDGTNPWTTQIYLADGTTAVTYYVYKYYTEGSLSADTFTITY